MTTLRKFHAYRHGVNDEYNRINHILAAIFNRSAELPREKACRTLRVPVHTKQTSSAQSFVLTMHMSVNLKSCKSM